MMIIELTALSLLFMLVGAYLGYTIGKARNNCQIHLPEWMTSTLDIFRR